MTEELAGQVAIVTGSGRGIGRAIAQALASAGAAVTVTARSSDELAETVALLESNGHGVLAVPADVTDVPAMERLVERTEQELGPVTLLVNNAGIGGPFVPLWEADLDDWRRVVEVNLVGTVIVTRAVLPRMIGRRHGRIINISGGGDVIAAPEVTAYACSKAAVLRLTDSLAIEVAGFGIRVFALQPGGVHTAMGERAAAWATRLREEDRYGFGKMPMPPWMPPERAAELCVTLASGQADALSGRHISAYRELPDAIQRAEEIRAKDLYTLRLRM